MKESVKRRLMTLEDKKGTMHPFLNEIWMRAPLGGISLLSSFGGLLLLQVTSRKNKLS